MGIAVILTVALNAALDVTYHLGAAAQLHTTQRVSHIDTAAGGKALNTARILHTLQTPTLATGLLGGHTGERILELLPPTLRHRFVHIAAESRRALVVADPIDATGFWEPGPQVSDAEWRAFTQRFAALAKVASVVVLSGSLPSGLDVDAYANLVHSAKAAGALTILDCDGEALQAALPQRPDIIKPNTSELSSAVPGADTASLDGTFAAAQALREAGAGTVVASRGEHGIAIQTASKRYAASPPQVLSGNPTGAGDACVAALARGAYYRSSWQTSLVEAVALSCAAVKSPLAGQVAVEDYLRFKGRINVKEC